MRYVIHLVGTHDDQLAQGSSPSPRVTIVGHADNVRGRTVNARLSLERAVQRVDHRTR
ncbi:MAG: hypothetical protein U1E89_17525 [Burkholderiaceae bacterium]